MNIELSAVEPVKARERIKVHFSMSSRILFETSPFQATKMIWTSSVNNPPLEVLSCNPLPEEDDARRHSEDQAG